MKTENVRVGRSFMLGKKEFVPVVDKSVVVRSVVDYLLVAVVR